jgi:hypothetical protein
MMAVKSQIHHGGFMQEVKFSRADYLDRKCTHQEYYRQFVTPYVLEMVRAKFGEARLRENTDPYFNDIPISRWDAMHNHLGAGAYGLLTRANGYGAYSQHETVCIVKAAAEMIREGQ